MKLKIFIVKALEELCDKTHWLTHHRPLIWVIPVCGLSSLSAKLDQKWNTQVWTNISD